MRTSLNCMLSTRGIWLMFAPDCIPVRDAGAWQLTMASKTIEVATACGFILCLAGLHSTEGLQSGTVLLLEGGNSDTDVASSANATLLTVRLPPHHSPQT